MQRYHAARERFEQSPTQAAFQRNHVETGISKPSIFGGLMQSLSVLGYFPANLMHLIALNLPDLILSLLCATLPHDAPDDKDTWDWACLHDVAI